MLCCIGKLSKRIIRCKYRNVIYIKLRMLLCIFHHLLIRNYKTILVVRSYGMANMCLPRKGTKRLFICMLVLRSLYYPLYMPHANNDTPMIFNTRNLFCISHNKGFIRYHIAIKIIKHCLMVIPLLNPVSIKIKKRLYGQIDIYPIILLHCRNSVFHQPCKWS